MLQDIVNAQRGKVDVELWELRIPLDPPIASARGPIKQTFVLLALAKDEKGNAGIGYSSFKDERELTQAAAVASGFVKACGPTLPALLNVERVQENFSGAQTPVQNWPARSAANALSLAAWDLAGIRRGLPCAEFWGRQAGREGIACYASALWLDQSIPQLIEEARGYRRQNYRYVKMRSGPSLQENLERIAAVQTVFPEPRSIAIEAAAEWTVDGTHEFLQKAPGDYLWIEDPVPHALMKQIRHVERNQIAAGEKCTSLTELIELHGTDGVPLLPLDVQYLGGPVRFMEAAHVLDALGAVVGAHRFSHYSVHLLACLKKSLPLEMLDWTNPALRPLPDPDKNGQVPVRGPGFGVSDDLDRSMLQKFGSRVDAL